MDSNISVMKRKSPVFSLDSAVFFKLFDNTIVRRERKFFKALDENVISYDDFMHLSRKGEVPYPLFFLEEHYIEDIIEKFNKKVYFGVSKEQLSLSSRGDFALSDISLILKDITRKQSYLKNDISQINTISGRFSHTSKSIIEEADEIRTLVGYDLSRVFISSKEKTFTILDSGLSALNVFVSLHVHNYSPQNISKKLQFSGVAINDKKCPFLFIRSGEYDSKIELWGRRLFTTALLLSCLLHSDCRPVTMDGACRDLITNQHYQFAEEFLMPELAIKKEKCASKNDIEEIARRYSVSPTAAVMRLFRLGKITEAEKAVFLNDLFNKWDSMKKDTGGGRKIEASTAIVRYNNRAVVNTLIKRYESKSLNESDFRNLLCLRKGERFDLEAIKNA